MGFELPYLPPGYSPQQVQQAGYQYAASHGYRGPHMVMQEGVVTYQNGVPGIMVKYVDGQGMSTTEWTPLPQAAPPQHPQLPPQQPASPVASALTGAQGLAAQPPHAPDAQNPKALAYAKHRLEQLAALGIQYQQYGDPTETWRHASETIAATAQGRGYDNPRDFLEGRPPNHPVQLPGRPQAPHPVGAPDQQHPSTPRGPVDRSASTPQRRPQASIAGSVREALSKQPQHPAALPGRSRPASVAKQALAQRPRYPR